MTADLARHAAAQARADEVIAAVGQPLSGLPHLVVAVTDPESGQRLATGFVTFEPGPGRLLRLVEERS